MTDVLATPPRRKAEQIRAELEHLRKTDPNRYALESAQLLYELRQATEGHLRYAKT